MAPAVPEKIPCTSPSEFAQELRAAREILDKDETEDNWEKMGLTLKRLMALTKGGAYALEPDFVNGMKGLADEIVRCMSSERTRLSGCAVDLLITFIPRLGTRFEPLTPFFVPPLLKLCTRTNKVFIARAQSCLTEIVQSNRLPSLLSYFREAVKDKSQSLRSIAAESVVLFLSGWKKSESKEKDWKVKWIEDVEAIVRITARDSNPEVRKISRRIFDCYKEMFPERVNDFVSPLTPITKKYLDINPSTITGNAGAGTSKPTKSSNKASSKSAAPLGPLPPLPAPSNPRPNLSTVPRRPNQPLKGLTIPFSASTSVIPSSGHHSRVPSHTRSISTSAVVHASSSASSLEPERARPTRVVMGPPKDPNSNHDPAPPSRRGLSRPPSSNSNANQRAAPSRPMPPPVRPVTSASVHPVSHHSREPFRPTSSLNLKGKNDGPPPEKTAAELAREEVLRGKPQRRIIVPPPPPPPAPPVALPVRSRAISVSVPGRMGAGEKFVPKREGREKRDLTAPTASQRAKVRDKPILRKGSGFIPKRHGKKVESDEIVKVAVEVPLPESPKLEALEVVEVKVEEEVDLGKLSDLGASSDNAPVESGVAESEVEDTAMDLKSPELPIGEEEVEPPIDEPVEVVAAGIKVEDDVEEDEEAEEGEEVEGGNEGMEENWYWNAEMEKYVPGVVDAKEVKEVMGERIALREVATANVLS